MATLLPRNKIKKLLGKWRSDRNSPNAHVVRGSELWEHIRETVLMTIFLMDDLPFGRKLFDTMDLGRWISFDNFRKICILAVLAHDLGKAGQIFQTMMWQLELDFQDWKRRLLTDPEAKANYIPYIQMCRHEPVSLHLLMTEPRISGWFREMAGGYFDIICAAAFGHHRKTAKTKDIQKADWPSEIYLEELTRDLGNMTKEFFKDSPEFPTCPDITVKIKDIRKTATRFLSEDTPETSVSIAVKWVVILGDVLGSMTAATEDVTCEAFRKDLEDRLQEIFRPMTVDYLSYTDFSEKGTSPNALQKEALDVATDIILQGGCGSGKTNAAYLACSQRPHDRLIFTTPTTGTASQHWANSGCKSTTATKNSRSIIDRRLYGTDRRLYGTAENIHLNPTEPSEEETAQLRDALEAFEDFDKEIVFATSDQILGILGFSHANILWLLYIVQSQVVFDEFHCYDDVMRQHYYQLLRWMPNLRAIAISATITSKQKSQFLRIRPNATYVVDRSENAPAKRPRYRLHLLKDETEAREFFKKGALWVVNQVGISQDLGYRYPEALIYHSRYQYPGRKGIQETLVNGFDPRLGERIEIRAITTQVAEMSLDLSALWLLSEIAPIAALIQRLGRLNRIPTNDKVLDAYFYMPTKANPYNKKELEVALSWIKSLEGRDLSQEDLALAFESLRDVTLDHPLETRMSDTDPREVRDSNGWTRRGLLPADANYLLSMPRRTPAEARRWKQELLLREVPFPVSGTVKKMIEDGVLQPSRELGFRYKIPGYLFHYDTRLGLIKND